jgi:hypothetical protein
MILGPPYSYYSIFYPYSRCCTIGGQTISRFYAKVELLLDYNNGIGVFYMIHAEMLQAGQSEAGWSCQQFS